MRKDTIMKNTKRTREMSKMDSFLEAVCVDAYADPKIVKPAIAWSVIGIEALLVGVIAALVFILI